GSFISTEPTDASRPNVITALHACDTATDDALVLAIAQGADHVAVVPCCQAEVARQLESAADRAPAVAELFAHPWHRREFGSHLTNVIRAVTLEARGYKVTVTELTGWEHSVKNELILGKKVRARSADAERRLEALLEASRVRPKLVRELPPAAAA
ncbi:MAG TPA: methyltransferase, partial [Anaeromyxobacteraceae bacterium]|nr:methyltransferase [Anaeromyxobacteraceae bacterium]